MDVYAEAPIIMDGFRNHLEEVFRGIRRMWDDFDQIPRKGRWWKVRGRGGRRFKFADNGAYLLKDSKGDMAVWCRRDGAFTGLWFGHSNPGDIAYVWVPLK